MFYKIKNSIVIPMIVFLLIFSASAFAGTGTGVTSGDVVSEDKKEEVQEVARVEVTGSRLAEDIREVPAPAYVITKEEIEMSGARSTQEVLDRVPGVNGLRNSSASALDKSVIVRGLTTEVLLLVDGIPFRTSSYGTGVSMGSPFDLRTVPLESIERIEVVKGASSAVYGSNAAGGVINIITKKGMKKSGGTLLIEGGNHGWIRGSVRGTAVLSDDVKVTVGYTKTQENAEINIRRRPDGTYDTATDYRGNDFVFGVEKSNWSFSAGWGDFDSEWIYQNKDYDGTYYIENQMQKNKYQRFNLSYKDEENSGRIYYNKNDRDYSYVSDTAGMSFGNYEYEDSSWGLVFNRKQEIFGLTGVWGFEWRRESSKYTGDSNWGTDEAFDLTRDGISPYLEVSVPIGEMGLDLGLRYEHWNVDEGEDVNELIPRLSLNWESPSGKIWYLTAGRFFSMPSFYQIWNPIRSMGTANPDLKPEKGWTYDIGVKDEKASNPWSLGIFYMDMEDKINYEYDPATWAGQYVNLDQYRAWGIEAEMKFNFHENWSYTQGISWTDADEKSEGSDEWTRSGIPRLDLSGSLNYAKGPWSAELNAHYYGDRSINSSLFKDDNIFLMNAAVSWKEGDHKLVLSCANIFNREFVLDSQGYINPERKFILSWQYEF
ncbi:MAG: TonB-dependent receptor [Synergistaceae bacterium]|nr:TonB-dependent receptor [Synergistaceae bacterium]